MGGTCGDLPNAKGRGISAAFSSRNRHTLTPHPEEPRKRRLEGWATAPAAHGSRRRFATPHHDAVLYCASLPAPHIRRHPEERPLWPRLEGWPHVWPMVRDG